MSADPFVFPVSARFADVSSSPVRDILAILARGDVISFAGGIPDATLFDYDNIRACFDHVLKENASRAFQYASTEGEPELRQAAAKRMSRWVPTSAEQIQVTTGSQEAIYLCAVAMLSAGDVVLVEEPTYLAAVQAFSMVGARLVSVPSDDDGVIPADLERLIDEHGPKLVYLIPNFQNPTGRTYSLQRRRDVAEVLVRRGVALMEDDPYGELRFEGESLPPLSSMPGMATQSLWLNSVSKVMTPGLRMGWIRAEPHALRPIVIAKQAVALQSPVTEQLVVAHYLENYDLDAHVASVREVYKVRRDAMYEGLKAMLPSSAHITYPTGGMFLWVRLGDGWNTKKLLDVAVEEGVAFVPGWPFYAGEPDQSTMRLSYVTNTPETIAEGLRRLGRAMERYAAMDFQVTASIS